MAVSYLETLPTELLCIIVELLMPWEVKDLSRASKRLRAECLPSLFRHVEIQFSQAGFDRLENITKLDVRHHVVSFTYVVPELLNAGILDFDRFKSDLLTPDSYMETTKDLYNAGGEADECPSYMVIYENIRSICKEQRSIMDNGVDRAVLSSALIALPRLAHVGLSFCKAIQGEDWLLSSFASDMTIAEKSYEYHVRVISDALQDAREGGIAIDTISLLGFDLPYYRTWEVPDLSTLSESLRKLLEPVQVLRLIYSNSPLELLSHCTIALRRLEMCHLVIKYKTLEDFLETNKKSMCSIGFHNIKTSGWGQLESNVFDLCSSMLCKMLKRPQSVPFRAADCGCLLFLKEGWRPHSWAQQGISAMRGHYREY